MFLQRYVVDAVVRSGPKQEPSELPLARLLTSE
ncbi:hypothetical protein RHDE110596_13465 [Prescottella defluvii]